MDEIEKSIRETAKAVVEARENQKEQSAVDVFNQKLELQFDTNKPPEEQVKAIIDVKAAAKAIEDEDLTNGVTDRKKAEILNRADANLKKEEAENKKAEILLQEANYGVYNGVATYAGIKKPLPQKMQKLLFTILSAFQLLLLIAIGFPISVVNILLDSVDSVIEKMGKVTRSARIIVLVALIGFVGWIIFLVVKSFLAQKGIFL